MVFVIGCDCVSGLFVLLMVCCWFVYVGELQEVIGWFGVFEVQWCNCNLIDFDCCMYCNVCIDVCLEGVIDVFYQIDLDVCCDYCVCVKVCGDVMVIDFSWVEVFWVLLG